MMYDFDTVVNRRGTTSVKWDILKENELPMWVADMDFKAAPEILQAIQNRMDNGVFGYSIIPEEWAQSYVNWWKTRHDFEMDPSWLCYSTGVIPVLSSAVRKFTTPNDNVVIQTPVYNVFFNSVVNNGRRVLESPLVYKDGEYSMDLEDLEKKLSDPQTTMMILCNPHNPVGKIWDKETLAKIGELCWKYNVLVVSDEIHCDITDPDVSYVPFASVSDHCRYNSITALAPTKAFNIAGIQSAAAMAANPNLRHKIWRALNTDEVGEPNAFSIAATIAAFNHGARWLDELRSYIYENKQIACKFVKENIPSIHIVPSKATYLLWLDCSAFCTDSVKLANEIRRKTGLFLSNGTQYGEAGKTFLRMNIACPKTLLLDGLDRLKRALV